MKLRKFLENTRRGQLVWILSTTNHPHKSSLPHRHNCVGRLSETGSALGELWPVALRYGKQNAPFRETENTMQWSVPFYIPILFFFGHRPKYF